MNEQSYHGGFGSHPMMQQQQWNQPRIQEPLGLARGGERGIGLGFGLVPMGASGTQGQYLSGAWDGGQNVYSGGDQWHQPQQWQQQQPTHVLADETFHDQDDDGALRAVRDLPLAFQGLYTSFRWALVARQGSLARGLLRGLSNAASFSGAYCRYFNTVQSECYAATYDSDANLLVSAPTGSGKTGVMELSLLRLLSKQLSEDGRALTGRRGLVKAVYLAPLRALCQEKLQDWTAR